MEWAVVVADVDAFVHNVRRPHYGGTDEELLAEVQAVAFVDGAADTGWIEDADGASGYQSGHTPCHPLCLRSNAPVSLHTRLSAGILMRVPVMPSTSLRPGHTMVNGGGGDSNSSVLKNTVSQSNALSGFRWVRTPTMVPRWQ